MIGKKKKRNVLYGRSKDLRKKSQRRIKFHFSFHAGSPLNRTYISPTKRTLLWWSWANEYKKLNFNYPPTYRLATSQTKTHKEWLSSNQSAKVFLLPWFREYTWKASERGKNDVWMCRHVKLQNQSCTRRNHIIIDLAQTFLSYQFYLDLIKLLHESRKKPIHRQLAKSPYKLNCQALAISCSQKLLQPLSSYQKLTSPPT